MRRMLMYVVLVALVAFGALSLLKEVGLEGYLDMLRGDSKVVKVETYSRQGVPGCDVYITLVKGAQVFLPPEAKLYPALSNGNVDTFFFETDQDCPPPPPGVKTSSEGPTTKAVYVGLAIVAVIAFRVFRSGRRRALA